MLNGQVIQQTMNMNPFGGSPPIGNHDCSQYSQELMKRGIQHTGVKEKLLSLDISMNVLNQAPNVGFERGMLSC